MWVCVGEMGANVVYTLPALIGLFDVLFVLMKSPCTIEGKKRREKNTIKKTKKKIKRRKKQE